MDQNSTNGTDKRNWRERLGIGSKEMPRISEEFPAPPVAAKPVATVKPAPMAPRAAPKPVAQSARSIPQSTATLDQEALASKLKSQREAAEKLAEQRVQAARQRAEAALVPPPPPQTSNGAAKPKFTFAEDAARAPAPLPPPPVRQVAAQTQQRPPALPPARPQLGAGVPPRAPAPQYQARQPLAPPPAYPPAYNGNQGYRPIDPATGYPVQPQYAPTQGYAPPQRQAYGQQPPRLQVPARNQNQDYGYSGYDGQRAAPRLNAPNTGRGPAVQGYQDEQDDIFEQAPARGGRRATAGDYQQAYREVESGYEDEMPRARGPGILLALLALALVVGFGSVWGYNNYIKPQTTVATGDNVPVIKAPESPAKVDGTSEDPAAGNNQTASPSKKQIYDRIVGDREVLGGEIVPTEEAPVQPVNNSQPIPEPDGQPSQVDPAANGTGIDGTPLPLPPPPGDGQQGSIDDPSGKTDQQMANITPAAGASQAAESPSGDTPIPLPEAPAPGEQVAAATPPVIEPTPEPPVPAETVAEAAPEPKPTPVVKKVVAPKPAEAKKVATAKPAKSLGAKPVVLVAPSKKPVANKTVEIADTAPIAGDSLYGDAPITQVETPPLANAPAVKKKKSLFDLFKGEAKTNDNAVALNDPIGEPELLPPVAKPVPAKPTTGAYVAQLASFKSKAEATAEYRNLSAKHGPIISRYAPIITTAQVAGSTRYRLSIGPMATQNVAASVCQSLFAAGQRDCLVNRQ